MPFSTVPFPRWLAPLSFLLVPVLFGVLALKLGQDANWNLRNYHWYNPHALLTGRWEFDVGPSGFFNPLLDIPVYLGAQVLPAKAVSFLLAGIHGLNYVLLFFLTRCVLRPWAEPQRSMAAVIVALVGVLGGGHIGLVGTTFNDNIVSLAVLGSALVIAQAPERLFTDPAEPALKHAALAGLVMGAGVGLKLPIGVFAVGFCLAFLLMAGPVMRRLLLSFCFGVGVLAGVAAFAGYWMLMMWRDYANPLFPYFNEVFGSPMGLPANYRDLRFLPHNVLEWAAYPIVFTLDPQRAGEIYFRDCRIAVALVLWLVTPVIMRLRPLREPPPVNTLAVRYLVLGCGLTLGVWAAIFGIYRYIIALEMMAPLLIAAAIAFWPVSWRLRLGAATLAFLFVAITAVPGNWRRLPHWTNRLVEVTAPAVPDPNHALVVVTGFEPVSFVIPAFPAQIPFLRLQGYLNDPGDGDTGLNHAIRTRIDRHKGDVFLLLSKRESATAQEVLPHYGLHPELSKCTAVQTNISTDVLFCPVNRLSEESSR